MNVHGKQIVTDHQLIPSSHPNTSSPTLPGEPGSYWPIRATYWEKKLPWNWVTGSNQCHGFLSLALSQLREGELEKRNRHKSVRTQAPPLYLFSHSLHPPTLSLPSSTPSTFLPLAIHFLSCLFCSLFAPRLKTLCVYVCMRACVCGTLWNDALIHSVLYFLIWLTITVRVNRCCISLFPSLSLWLSHYFFPSLPLSTTTRVSCFWMEVFTSSVVLRLQERGLEYEWVGNIRGGFCALPKCMYFFNV